MAQQSGQGSPVAHEEERHDSISPADLLHKGNYSATAAVTA